MIKSIWIKDMKICLPLYKIGYSIIFVLLLSLVRGISSVWEIGGAMDSNIALLAIIFCSNTYEMEYQEKRWELFCLYPVGSRAGAIGRRMGIQTVYLCMLAYAGYGFFYWQKPREVMSVPSGLLYGMYVTAVTVTILFWGMLSQTIVNITRSLWAGIGISVVLWLCINSKAGERLLGKYNVFAFSFREFGNIHDFSWLWGKGAALIIAVVLAFMIPVILKREHVRQQTALKWKGDSYGSKNR